MPAEYPDDIKKQHPFYEDNLDAWQLIYDAYSGGSDFISTTYMIQHPHENTAAYNARIKRAMYFNFMRQSITKMVRLIMAEGVLRSGTAVATLQQFINDANGYGTAFNSFMRDAGVVSAMYGNAHILVDFAISQDDGEIKSLSDILDGQVYPTVELMTPLQLINWRKRRRRGYEWCVFSVKRIVEDQEKDCYIKVDYENIQEVDDQGEPLTEPFAHGLGFCPVFDLPYADVHRKDMQRGIGTDLAYNAKGILNITSLAEEVADRHSFTQLIMPDDGAIEELQAKQSDYIEVDAADYYDYLTAGQDPVLAKLAKSTVMTFPANTGHPPAFISPDSSQLEAIWSMVQGSIDTALYTSGITDKSGKVDSDGMGAILFELARNMESLEVKIFQTVMLYMGTQPSADAIEVTYPTAFSVQSFDDWMKQFSSVAGLATVQDDFKLQLLKNMVLTMPGSLTQTQKMAFADSLALVAPVVPDTGKTTGGSGGAPVA